MRRLLYLSCVLALTLVSSAQADLKITAQVTGSGMASAGDGETVTYIQGMKLRTDHRQGNKVMSTLLDLDKRQMVVLDSKKKRADVFDLRQLSQQQEAISDQDVKVSVEPTGESRQILGYDCDVHQMSIRVTAAASDQPMSLDVVVEGPVCLAPDAPGREEYLAFYEAMADRGMFLGDPRAAEQQPGREKGMSALYKSMAGKGVGLHSEIGVRFDGSGMMARMMKRLGFTMTTTATEISTDSLSADIFTIPSGYKTRQQ